MIGERLAAIKLRTVVSFHSEMSVRPDAVGQAAGNRVTITATGVKFDQLEFECRAAAIEN